MSRSVARLIVRRGARPTQDALPARRAIDIIDAHVRHRVPIKVAFANAHTLNTARVNPRYREVLQRFAVFNDGVGVDVASWLRFGERFPDNLNGTDFVPAYLERARQPLRIFMLGARPQVIERAFEVARDSQSSGKVVVSLWPDA